MLVSIACLGSFLVEPLVVHVFACALFRSNHRWTWCNAISKALPADPDRNASWLVRAELQAVARSVPQTGISLKHFNHFRLVLMPVESSWIMLNITESFSMHLDFFWRWTDGIYWIIRVLLTDANRQLWYVLIRFVDQTCWAEPKQILSWTFLNHAHRMVAVAMCELPNYGYGCQAWRHFVLCGWVRAPWLNTCCHDLPQP